jgi:hypothetical protein
MLLTIVCKKQCYLAGMCLAVVSLLWTSKGGVMKNIKNEKGAIGWILLWALGIPIPILLLFFVLRGCT